MTREEIERIYGMKIEMITTLAHDQENLIELLAIAYKHGRIEGITLTHQSYGEQFRKGLPVGASREV